MSFSHEKFGGNGGRFSGWIPMISGTKIRIWSGQVIDAIEINGIKYGGNGGSPSPIYSVDPDERLVQIKGGCGDLLDRIQFYFENDEGKRTFTPNHGGNGGNSFSISAPHIIDIGFNYGNMVDCIWIR